MAALSATQPTTTPGAMASHIMCEKESETKMFAPSVRGILAMSTSSWSRLIRQSTFSDCIDIDMQLKE
ncbi:hypothetical protein GCM10007886_28900 [Methylobacterium gregans]|nr:hypothetical protein GCM10007886_28900 [Methylobacterium gregans]